jgi:myosin heavy subunit
MYMCCPIIIRMRAFSCRPDSLEVLSPSCSSPASAGPRSLHGQTFAELQRQLAAAEDACRQHQLQKAAAAKEAGVAKQQLQKRGEQILQLQAELAEQERLNAVMRGQLEAAGGDATAAAAAEQASSTAGVTASMSATVEVQELQQQLLQLQEELAVARSAAVSPVKQPRPDLDQQVQQHAAAAGISSSAAGAVDADPDAAAEPSAAAASASAAASAAVTAAAAAGAAELAQQHQELTAYVRQLEAQAVEREALLGGLLGQVGACWL